MALLDIADVSRSLVLLIQQAFAVSPAWTLPPPTVLPEPPNRLSGEGIGFYLYHIQENPNYRNFPTPGKDQPAVRYTPMALSLFYQLSANSTIDDGTGAYNEQLMMSIAIKALHDFPVITDDTQIIGTHVLVPALIGKDNRFKITLQPIPFNEAVQYWTAGTSPIKLSAYYEVSVVFLEPDDIRSYAGRVLSYGTFIFTEGAPRIIGTQNIITFTVPSETTPAQVKLQPAQVAPGSPFDIFGTGFSGDQIDLALLNPRFNGPAIAGPPWNVTLSASNQLTATARETAILEATGAVIDLLPGIYAAQVVVRRRITLPNGDIRVFKNVSNQSPFIITPRVDSIANTGGNVFRVTGYLFQHPDLPEEDLSVYLGENRLERSSGGVLQPGEYLPTAANTLDIQLPAGFTTGQLVPVRILIAGAESPPEWITVP
jgi:hypothetical protein